MQAPTATSVEVNFPDRPVPAVPLTKDAQGLWGVTLGPFEPNLYEYQYVIDGVTVADPGNGHPKPQREVNTSLLWVPGNPPDFLDLREDVPHGTIHEELYRSKVLSEMRPLLVYTPPGYERHDCAPLPVLYLYHGYGDTLYSWVREGRMREILDNLLAQGKVVPMVVAIVENHALALESHPPSPLFRAYLEDNAPVVDRETFEGVIPFMNARYNLRQDPAGRAIAVQIRPTRFHPALGERT
ncbi:MAG: esterase family protein, partial [Verrucomicrobia bacterium]|nr:esterase family protein [Verrucomicrobiota bacterium]